MTLDILIKAAYSKMVSCPSTLSLVFNRQFLTNCYLLN